ASSERSAKTLRGVVPPESAKVNAPRSRIASTAAATTRAAAIVLSEKTVGARKMSATTRSSRRSRAARRCSRSTTAISRQHDDRYKTTTTCGSRIAILALKRAFGNVARRQRLPYAHEEPSAQVAAPGRHGREALWARWRARRDGGESAAQAATDRLAAWPPACAEPEAGRPAAVRILLAVPQSAAYPSDRHCDSALEAACPSSGVGGPQVSSAVLIATLPQEARAERTRRGTRPHDRGAEVAQSSLRLPSHCADRLADVRARHR